jgi:hypothetical protein
MAVHRCIRAKLNPTISPAALSSGLLIAAENALYLCDPDHSVPVALSRLSDLTGVGTKQKECMARGLVRFQKALTSEEFGRLLDGRSKLLNRLAKVCGLSATQLITAAFTSELIVETPGRPPDLGVRLRMRT